MSVRTSSVHGSFTIRDEPTVAEPAASWNASAGLGPDGGTWTHADWVARLRPTTSPAITAYPMRDVWLIEVTAPFAEVAQEVDHAVGQALAECPRGVVLELTVPLTQTMPHHLDMLAATGRHPWAWPATPVAVSIGDPSTAILLQQRPYGRHLTLCSSMLQGWAQIMTCEPSATAHLQLVPTAPATRVVQQFVAQTCLDWRLPSRRETASVIAGELTTVAVQRTNAGVDVLLSHVGERLRIAVRDRGPTQPCKQGLAQDQTRDQDLCVVRTLADLTGTLPTKDGGQMVWAVLGPDLTRRPRHTGTTGSARSLRWCRSRGAARRDGLLPGSKGRLSESGAGA